jgi:hypothetical protein
VDFKSAAYAMPLKENSPKIVKGLEVTFEIKNMGKTPATIGSVKGASPPPMTLNTAAWQVLALFLTKRK